MHERVTRRRLPHWDQPGATYFVTTCLLGSIPAQGLMEIEQMRSRLEGRVRPAHVRPDDWKARLWKRIFAGREDWLDCKPAVRYLEDKRLATEVVRSLKHFDGERYDLVAWVVMPSHLHWVFRPRDAWIRSVGTATNRRSPRQRIQHSVNLHTAIECNRLLGRTGGFWQRESYHHCVRDEEELERIVAYIHGNPIRAGLAKHDVDFPFSSAGEYASREGVQV